MAAKGATGLVARTLLLRRKAPPRPSGGSWKMEQAPVMEDVTRDLGDVERPMTLNDMSRAETYRPTLRPKNVVMPIDPDAREDSERFPSSRDAVFTMAQQIKKLRDAVRDRGAVKLSAVPEERNVADAYAFCEDYCRTKKFLKRTPGGGVGTAPIMVRGEPMDATTLLPVASEAQRGTSAYGKGSFVEIGRGSVKEPAATSSDDLVKQREGHDQIQAFRDMLHETLSRTPLSAPVHGALAMRGAAMVDEVIARDATSQFPRLRSAHIQRLQHLLAGLLPCCRVAQSIGLVDACGLEIEVAMWRELNHAWLHREWAQGNLSRSRELRDASSPASQHRFYAKHARATKLLVAKLPVKRHELQPRIEWLRSHVHAFVATVAERHGEDVADNLIRRLFCPELSFGPAGTATSAFAPEHPLSQITAMRAMGAETSSASYGGGLYTDRSLTEDIRRFPDVPATLLQAVRPGNSLREAQLVLAYDPSIPSAWRDAPLDFEVEFVTAELDDAADLVGAISDGKQRRAENRLLRVRMVIGANKRVVGIGHGTTEREAMDAAARHMLQRYYFRRFAVAEAESEEEPPAAASVAVSEGGRAPIERAAGVSATPDALFDALE